MILHDELRDLGLPWVPEAVAFRPAEGWLTLTDTLQAVAVSSAIVQRMRRRIPVGDELRVAAWRCTVAGLRRLPREAWPTRRPDVAVDAAKPQDAEPTPQADTLVIRRRGEGGQHHAS
jgi:hypothetical protein